MRMESGNQYMMILKKNNFPPNILYIKNNVNTNELTQCLDEVFKYKTI